MNARKPVDPNCDGSVICQVDGHVLGRWSGGNRVFEHIPLTNGQQKTIRERNRAVREQKREVTR